MSQDTKPGNAASDAPIVVLGATSGIGALVVDEALRRGLPVRGFARSADKMAAREGLAPVAGDARSPDDLARAVHGARAVIYALGIKERPAMLWQHETLFSQSTKALLDVMEKARVTRLVAVTGFGAGRSRAAMSSVEKLGHGLLLGRVYADKSRQEELIENSTLDWTIARPVILTKGARTGKVRELVSPTDWRNGLVSRSDVAEYLVRSVVEGLNIREDVVLAR
ncbi:MAG: NAD(P)H-binding protein [Alphaproteobacteria bacterium]|nr:NAD(P)H-binding protein [Alphaproteobacteria bacterium]